MLGDGHKWMHARSHRPWVGIHRRCLSSCTLKRNSSFSKKFTPPQIISVADFSYRNSIDCYLFSCIPEIHFAQFNHSTKEHTNMTFYLHPYPYRQVARRAIQRNGERTLGINIREE